MQGRFLVDSVSLNAVVHCTAWLQFEDKEPERRITVFEVVMELFEAWALITVEPELLELELELSDEGDEEPELGALPIVTHGMHHVKPKNLLH